jgi:hypothetical protein
MIPNEVTEQLRSELKRLKDAQAAFLQTYERLCIHHGGPAWLQKKTEMVLHRVRSDVIPVMKQLGMDDQSVEALCSWAEHLLSRR